MRALATVFVVIGILVAATREPADAATLNVPGSYTTIAKAITASKSGDVIVIAPGTYKENLSLKSGVTLRGAGMGVTIIDGRAMGTVIYVTGAATPSTIIEDLTVTNGKNTNGAGIKLGPENECQVRRVEFRSNVATNRGGGLYLDVNSRATIEYNFFVENRARSGAGIYCQTSFSTFRFNVIYDNVATVNGGGFYGAFDCSEIYNNTIDGNQSPGNGANVALASPASTKFYRNILSNGEDGFGLWQSGGTATNECNVIWQNEAGQMSGASTPIPNTIFNVDPLYCDYAIKDFHLQGPSPAALVDCKEPADFVGALPVNCNFLEPTQACCYPEGVCNDLTVDECVAQGGTPQGEGTSCEDVTCEPPPDPTQACCFADGTCFDVTVAECVSEDGVPQGEGSTCESASCPPPPPTPQACCFHVGSCADLLEADCITAGGLPQGPGTNCATTPDCENLGACCLDDGSCIAQTAQGCTAQGGVFQGVGVRCRDAHCAADRTLKHAATESKTWGGIKRIYR